MTKEHPILFSTPMVKAILEDRKTQTRRIVKGRWLSGFEKGFLYDPEIKSPYGKIGDILWVRETHLYYSDENGNDVVLYKADPHAEEFSFGLFENKPKWRPAIHMAKDACRLRLKITDIRVERLQDISKEDAIAEGIEPMFSLGGVPSSFRDYQPTLEPNSGVSAKYSYQTLWSKINGKESWEANPWVWVIEF